MSTFWLEMCSDVNAYNNNNNNNNTSICKAHNVSIRAESEAPAVARWRGWLEG